MDPLLGGRRVRTTRLPARSNPRGASSSSTGYRELLANTTWNFHELSGLTIQPTESGFTVGFDVDWQGAVSDGSEWPSNLEAGQFRFAMRQDWQVAVRSGPAAENPFEILTLVARPR